MKTTNHISQPNTHMSKSPNDPKSTLKGYFKNIEAEYNKILTENAERKSSTEIIVEFL